MATQPSIFKTKMCIWPSVWNLKSQPSIGSICKLIETTRLFKSRSDSTADIKEYAEKLEQKKVASAKPNVLEAKMLTKSDIIHMLDQDSGNGPSKTRSLASMKRARAKEKRIIHVM